MLQIRYIQSRAIIPNGYHLYLRIFSLKTKNKPFQNVKVKNDTKFISFLVCRELIGYWFPKTIVFKN